MKKEANPVRLLIVFIAAVLVLAAASISYKIFVQISESKYNSSTLNLLMVDKDAYLLHMNKDKNILLRVKFPYKREEFVNRSKLSSSVILGVPIDAVLISNNQLEFANSGVTLGTISNSLFSPGNYRITDFNQYDLLKVFLAMNSIDEKNSEYREVAELERADWDAEANRLWDGDAFRDREIFNEKVSIEIVNATGINGIGGIVSGMLIRIGFNVVATETGDQSISSIKYKNDDVIKTKTFRRVDNIFNIKNSAQNSDLIADISIVLGKDLVGALSEE